MSNITSNILESTFKVEVNEYLTGHDLEVGDIDYYPNSKELNITFKDSSNPLKPNELQCKFDLNTYMLNSNDKLHSHVTINTFGKHIMYNIITEVINIVNTTLKLNKGELDTLGKVYECILLSEDDILSLRDKDELADMVYTLGIDKYIMYNNVPHVKLKGDITRLMKCTDVLNKINK